MSKVQNSEGQNHHPSFSFFKLKLFIPIVLLLLFFSLPTQAFSDNFNDNDITDWTINNGVPFLSNTNGIDSYYLSQTAITTRVWKLTGVSNANYYSWYMAGSLSDPVYDEIFVYVDDNGTHGHYIQFSGNNGAVASNIGSYQGWDTNFKSVNNWIKVEITKYTSPNNIKIEVYNATSGNTTLMNSQTLGFTSNTDGDRIYIEFNTPSGINKMRIDSIIVSGVSPSSTNSITWGSTSYVKDDSGFYSWTITEANWDDWYYYYNAYIDKNGVNIDSASINSQTGSYRYKFTDIGSYDVQLWKCPLNVCIFGTKIANHIISVRGAGVSYIDVPPSVGAGIPFNVSYSFGYTPTQGYLNGFTLKKLATDGNYKTVGFQSANNLAIVAGTLYTASMTIGEEGTYLLELTDYIKGKAASSKIFLVTYVFIPPTTNISTSYIKTDRLVYYWGETILIDYGIDNTNYSSYSTKYIDIYNNDATNGLSGLQLKKQQGSIEIPIINSQEDEICIFDTACFIMPQRIFRTGANNQIQLKARNTSNSITISFVNFTLNGLNDKGYGLEISKGVVCQNEQFTINVTSPSVGELRINKDIPGHITSLNIKSYIINGSTQISQKLTDVANYEIILIADNQTQVSQYVIVKDCKVTPIPTSKILTGDTNVCTSTIPQINGWVGLMGFGLNDYTRLGFAMLFIMGFVFLGWGITKNGQIGLSFGFLPYAFFASLSFADCGGVFMPKWVTIFLGILLALSFRIFR